MFQTLEIQNFRCFADLRLDSLARVNLIGGKNNTGKTALLEAIRLHCNPSNPLIALGANRERGVTSASKDLKDLAGWLFLNRDLSNEVVLRTTDGQRQSRRSSIALTMAAEARQRFAQVDGILASLPNVALDRLGEMWLVLRSQVGGKEETCISDGVTFAGRGFYQSFPDAFLSTFRVGGEADLDSYGELETANRQEEILPALRILEPRLQRLSLIPFAGSPILHGDIGLPRLVPLPLMGEGIRRLLSILLAIATHKSGVVLIDEVENGLHHSVMSKVWQAIGLAARQANVQVFATTHSYECILAAHTAFESAAPYEFAFHRLDRTESGGIKPVSYDRDSIDYALEMSHELR